MKDVMQLVERRKHEFARLPLCQFLEDETIDPRQRLAWAPCLAPFALGFGDLNKYALRHEPTDDPFQQLINRHTYEDDHHWVWFLEDLEKLGLDLSLKFSDAMRFFWGSQTYKTRQVCQQIAMATYGKEPIVVLAAIEAIEATGNVVLSRTAKAAEELRKTTQQNYRYFGQHHFCVETGHAMGTEDVEDLLETIELKETQRSQAYELVELVFDLFTDCLNELMDYITQQNAENPYAKPGQKIIEMQRKEGKVSDTPELALV